MKTKTRLKRKLVFFATANVHKFNEARRILAEFGIATVMINIKGVEIQDTDIERIAKTSALDAAKKCSLPLFVEDAGLFIKALNGFPGPYSSYVYKTLGTRGILKLMENVEDRAAEFRSVVAYYEPEGGMLKTFQGKAEGKIVEEPRGTSGFGFDPIFQPVEAEGGRTFAEMSTEEKNRYSHRARALRSFAEWFLHRG